MREQYSHSFGFFHFVDIAKLLLLTVHIRIYRAMLYHLETVQIFLVQLVFRIVDRLNQYNFP